ncbi:tetratricopeptide repeat protein [Nitrogeniibacter mangrovi]|uniref:Tetratricopeptide repeat protein n=1 Tax=Nitrogeniibacter mangrovi TaxID=2016596 RepID=A0A6C1B752_9RHOO|nr:tetratricopeptide repeat protein [Nitrogeniibacter mangrovi]QID18789.1 tetratricopeptide repeat protein [Nitrogeniibacter mangrovi]
MSLLIDALRKAEQDRDKSGPDRDDLEGLSLEPMAPPPAAAAPQADAGAADREAAARLFATKADTATPNRLVWLALAGVLAGLALIAYVWWQMQPAGGIRPMADTPRPVAPAMPAEPAAPMPAQVAAEPVPEAAPAPSRLADDASTPAPAESEPPLPSRPQRGSLGRAAEATPAAAPAPPATPHLTRTTPTPARVPPLLEKGYAAYQAGRLDEAAAAYQAQLDVDPNNVDALNGMGAIAMQAERPAEAIRWFRRTLTAQPDDPVALAGLASLLPAEQAVDDESRLRGLLDEAPTSPAAAFALGNALARQQRWAEAQEAYFSAYSGEPTNPDYLYNLAVSLDHLAQPALAREFYRRALDAAAGRPAVFDPAAVQARLSALAEPAR